MSWRPGHGVVIGVAVFWVCVVVGGLVNPGYSHRRDFLSALAGNGSAAPWVGVAGIVGFSAAMACAAALWFPVRRPVGALLGLSAAGGLVAAGARLDCPDGAAGCHIQDGVPATTLDNIHTAGISVFAGALVAAMVVVAIVVGRDHVLGRERRVVAGLVTLSLTCAVGGLVALAFMSGAAPGIPQRVWVVLNSVWLLLAGTAPAWTRSSRRARDAADV